MPKTLAKGMKINGYVIETPFDPGGMAQAAKAKSPTGKTVFFKQYKLPTVRSSWYKGYIAYQEEIKRRINSSDASKLCYQFLDFFQSKDTGIDAYYQVFEFISGGRDVSEFLGDPKTTWDQRVIFAKTFMNGMRILHDQKIIHTDLKPQNLYLFPAAIEVGYVLKIIDMDFAILGDKTAPWHGSEGYVGTPLYYSPEHLTGKIPVAASDIFTCGLILYELLAQSGHPYNYPDDPEKYQKEVMAYSAPAPELLGTFGTKQRDQAVVEVLRRMLSPDPAARPTAKEVHFILLGLGIEKFAPAAKTTPTGKTPSPAVPPPAPAPAARSTSAPPPAPRPVSAPAPAAPTITVRPAAPPAVATPPAAAPAAIPQLAFVFDETGAEVRSASGFTVGGCELSRLKADFRQFYAREQFKIQYSGEVWTLTPCPGVTNKTFVNGAVVHDPVELKDGDVIAVGNEVTKKTVCPIRVKFMS